MQLSGLLRWMQGKILGTLRREYQGLRPLLRVNTMRPVIVGAGIGGLCAASLLSLSGKDSLVLEREHRVGGRATSYSYEGCLLDHGWHASYYKEGYVGGHIGAILNDLGLPLKLEKLDPPLSMFRNGYFLIQTRKGRQPGTKSMMSLPAAILIWTVAGF